MSSIIPQDLIDSAVDWADSLGYLGLALLTASEAAIQPIPPDPLIWKMVLEAGSGFEILLIVAIATLSSVGGALVGYLIGMYAGGWLMENFVSEGNILRLEKLVSKYGALGIFIAAVSPIPYKGLAWVAGAGRMNLKIFIAAGIFGRGIRFGVPGVLLGVFGENIVESLNWLTFSLISVASLVFLIPAMNWWNSLLLEEPISE